MADGNVRVHQQETRVDVQVVGWGRMHESLPLRRYVERCVSDGATSIRVDLRQCTYLDSTFLGTLLYLQRTVRRRGGGHLVLISPSSECTKLLKQIGVDGCFATEVAEPAQGAWVELCADRSDAQAFNRTVVEAHQELASLEGDCGRRFQPVARSLTKDWENNNPPKNT